MTRPFPTFVAMELGVSFEDVNALVMAAMVIRWCRYSPCQCRMYTRNQVHLRALAEIVKRTANGGAEIVNFLKTGSAFYAPSASAVTMAEAVLKDKKRILPVAAYLNGEYGAKDIYTGVPCIIGGNGVEKIIEIDLTPDEKAALDKSIQAVRDLMKVVGLGS